MNNDDPRTQISYLVVVVLEVWMLTLQLNHLQLGDPLLLFGSHEITVRIPALCFSTNRSYVSINKPISFSQHEKISSRLLSYVAPTFGIYAVFDWGVLYYIFSFNFSFKLSDDWKIFKHCLSGDKLTHISSWECMEDLCITFFFVCFLIRSSRVSCFFCFC